MRRFGLPAIVMRTLILLSILLVPALPAAAETKQCTAIDALPYTIASQGAYCLRHDLVSGGSGVTIAASNVTLDCNGHQLEGQLTGIRANGVSNPVVRNCRLRGFDVGIWLSGGDGALVEGNVVAGSGRAGIDVQGDGSVVRTNRVLDVGGAQAGHYWGISATGDADVTDNQVADILSTRGNVQAVGIAVSGNTGGSIGDNRVRNVRGSGTGASFGILAVLSHGLSIYDNRVANPVPGTPGSAIRCDSGEVDIASGNHASGFSSGIHLCADGGSNTVLNLP